MIVIEYLIYDDEPEINRHGEYVGVAPAYGSIVHVEANITTYLGPRPLPSECVWIVPGTIDLEG